jgi:hypothetical protein
MAAVALVINLSVLIWTVRTFRFEDGVAQVFAGNCHESEKINTWIHLAINALSTMLLSGSNYCMQILSAPTRKEVDIAHARRKWLDIGVPSVRNLTSVATPKLLMWVLLGLSSIPLHLMYNSVFFSTIAANEYDIIFAIEAFIKGGPDAGYNDTEFSDLLAVQAKAKTWDRLERLDCINAYATEFLNTRGSLVAVINDPATAKNDSVKQIMPYRFQYDQNYPGSFDAYGWICAADDAIERYGFTYQETSIIPCSTKLAKVRANADRWHSYEWNIDYCLSEPVKGMCSLNFSLSIIVVVIICNFLKAITMLYISVRIRDKPLATVGDAIDSFLNINDPTTEGMCLISKTAIEAGKGIQSFNGMPNSDEEAYVQERSHKSSMSRKPAPTSYVSLHKRWFNATSGLRWYSCIFLFLCCMIAVAILLGFGVATANSNNGITMSFQSLVGLGLGSVHPITLISGWSLPKIGGNRVVASVLIANIPQPILSFVYLLFNGVFTSMFLADEWSDFAHERKPLRVSRPKPGQRSTFFLQLPYKYAVPLMILSGILHWSVSQSIFLAQVASLDINGKIRKPAAISTCGYSPAAIMLTMIMGTILASFVGILGLRRYRPGIPLAGSCSAAISAACHGRSDIDTTAPLKWGVTSEIGFKIGHCAFSDKEVQMPTPGSSYAGCRKRGRD